MKSLDHVVLNTLQYYDERVTAVYNLYLPTVTVQYACVPALGNICDISYDTFSDRHSYATTVGDGSRSAQYRLFVG